MGPGQVAHDVETRRQTAHLHRWCQALHAGVHRDSLCPELDERYGPFLPGQDQGPGDAVTGVPPQLLISCILLTVSPPVYLFGHLPTISVVPQRPISSGASPSTRLRNRPRPRSNGWTVTATCWGASTRPPLPLAGTSPRKCSRYRRG